MILQRTCDCGGTITTNHIEVESDTITAKGTCEKCLKQITDFYKIVKEQRMEM